MKIDEAYQDKHRGGKGRPSKGNFRDEAVARRQAQRQAREQSKVRGLLWPLRKVEVTSNEIASQGTR